MFGDNIKEAQEIGLLDEGGYGFEDEPSGLAALRADAAAAKVGRLVATRKNGGRVSDIASRAEQEKAQQERAQRELAIEIGVQWAREMQENGLKSARQLERLREGVAQYMLGVIRVVRLRQEKRLPSVEEYIRLRRMDGAEWLGLLACEFDVHIELEDETLQHPLIQRLRWATVNQMLWINDLLSFYRESHIDDYVSLLAVLHYNNVAGDAGEKQTGKRPPLEMADFEEAMAQARAMIKEADDECMRLTHEIAAWRNDLGPYIDSTLYFVSGLAFWTLWSSRYHTRAVLFD
ncbi:hypothetical protein L7F22_065408 [Adiantum nelumboides]|nr:hypothetical protein [Adiantum nelumboides]